MAIKNILIIAGVVTGIFLAYGIWQKVRHNTIIKKAANTIQVAINDTVSHSKDDAGRTHADRQVTVDENIIAVLYKERDSLAKALKIAKGEIKSLVAIKSTATGVVTLIHDTTNLRTTDSINMPFTGNDGYLFVRYVPGLPLQYNYTDSIIAGLYYKRMQWYKPKKLFVNAYSLNPNARIEGLTAFQVQDAIYEPWIEVGIMAQWCHTVSSIFTPALYADVRISRVHLRGTYGYSFSDDPVIRKTWTISTYLPIIKR